MMWHRIFTIFVLCISLNGFSQDEVKKNIYKGNVFYLNNEFKDAVYYYEKAIDQSPFDFKANYNLANAFFKLKEYDKAISKLESIADYAKGNQQKAMLQHNIGNCNLMNKKLDEAIDAYKASLRLNPFDEETRYNLAFALQMKKQQEQQKKEQNKDDENKEDKEQGKKEQDEDGDKKDKKEGQDKKDGEGDEDKKEEDDKEGEQKDKPKDGEGDKDKPEKKDQASQPKPNQLSKEQAKRILEAAAKKEKEIQDKKDKNLKVITGKPKQKKDW